MNTFNHTFSGSQRIDSGSEKPVDLFLEKIREVFFAEQTLQKILPRLAKAASSLELTSTFDLHAAQTEEHVKKLKPIFYMLGERPEPRVWYVVSSLVDEYYYLLINPEEDSSQRELKLIKTTQELEKYLIATYDSLFRMARDMEFSEAAAALHLIMNQEQARLNVLQKMQKHWL
jgi:ferritin-like metal-binding protein YciE